MILFRITSRSLALIAALAVAQAAGLPGRAAAQELTLVSPSQKVCQLTGDTDWATNQPTAARTDTSYHLNAVDLGFPVDSGNGPLFFLFGDSRPKVTLTTIPPDDALGYTTRTAPPDMQSCLDLKLMSPVGGGSFGYVSPTVSPSILQGAFNVPTGGVFVNDTFYAFFWTNHCIFPQALAPSPLAPLHLPTPVMPPTLWSCAETPGLLNSIGQSVLAYASATAPAAFEQNPSVTMPNGFVYVSAAAPLAQLKLPAHPTLQRPGKLVPVFGVARYRASIPYLALAPHDTFDDPNTWWYFVGGPDGEPKFVTRAEWDSGRTLTGEWSPPRGAELYADSVFEGLNEHCVGEHSVTWNAPLHRWLLLYVCDGVRVEARMAPMPWGPWSKPTVLLRGSDPGVVCGLIMRPGAGCAPLPRDDYWPKPGSPITGGFFYAPFAMERFTQDLSPPGNTAISQTKIFWLLSTWNPYQVIVMQSTLQLGP